MSLIVWPHNISSDMSNICISIHVSIMQNKELLLERQTLGFCLARKKHSRARWSSLVWEDNRLGDGYSKYTFSLERNGHRQTKDSPIHTTSYSNKRNTIHTGSVDAWQKDRVTRLTPGWEGQVCYLCQTQKKRKHYMYHRHVECQNPNSSEQVEETSALD